MDRMLIAVLLLSAGLAGSASAHNPLKHPDWCTENGRLLVVDQFEWDGESLARWVGSRKGDDTCSTTESNRSGTKTCGQFDDDWSDVDSRAAHHCDRYTVRFEGATHSDHGTVIHIAEGPEAFNDEEGHHERYRAGMGLRALCVRCEPLEIEPVESSEQAVPVR